jgi:porin
MKNSYTVNRCAQGASALASLSLLCAGPAMAQDQGEPVFSYEIAYTADVTGVVAGGRKRGGRFLDNLDLIGDLDLARAIGWRGARLHADVLNNSGGQPNNVAGTIEGIDSIEVSRARTRLYELWVEQALADGGATLRAGLYDLNSEFYVTDSAGLMISPSFGIGSEFSSTGPNGPSIFPSTAEAVRLRVGGETGGYLQAAVLNARAGTLGDPGGPDFDFDGGALTVAEAGVNGRTRVAVGAWRYTKRQDDIRDLTPAGNPAQRRSQGAYLIVERALLQSESGPDVHSFFRGGVSDGRTSPFVGGWQSGVLVEHVFPARPDSAFSIGLAQGLVSKRYRANGADEGLDLGPAESRIEVTYSDSLAGRLTLQPDLQVIRRPGADRNVRTAVVAALRVSVSLP